MAFPKDPFEPHLKRAAELFESGDIVQAGQIWQAILKRNPDHEVARAGLYKVKLYFDARATQGGLVSPEARAAAPAPAPAAQAEALGVDRISALLDQGCTLYDAGQLREALAKWNQILALDPGNTLARGYANGARRALGMEPLPDAPAAEPEAEQAPAPSPLATMHIAALSPETPAPEPALPPPPPPVPPAETLDLGRLLRDGCTLYDMGEAEGALRKWEQILSVDSKHSLALEYVRSARRDLGLAPLDEAAPARVQPAPPPPPPTEPAPAPEEGDERVARLLRDAVQLYDMGMTEEAIAKWEQVLALKPDHREAQEYLKLARRDLEPPKPVPAPRSVPPIPPPPPPARADRASLAPLFREAEFLLHEDSFDGAAQAFQKILAMDPSNARALQGYQQARTLANARVSAPTFAEEEPAETRMEDQAAESAPPESVTAPSTSLRRRLDIESSLRSSGLLPFLQSPKIVLGTIGGLACLILLGYLLIKHGKEVQLRAAVAADKANAMSKIARNSEVDDLSEGADAIRKEAESAVSGDPLLAYFRAQELIRINAGDAAAARILEQAKASLAQAQPKGTLVDLEKLLQERDLESAQTLAAELLKQSPDDPDLRARTARICLAMAQIHATQGHWDEAQDQLKRGRAMFPTDKTWQGRLALLAKLRGMSAAERGPWLQLLD